MEHLLSAFNPTNLENWVNHLLELSFQYSISTNWVECLQMKYLLSEFHIRILKQLAEMVGEKDKAGGENWDKTNVSPKIT